MVSKRLERVLTIGILLSAIVGPNLFVIAQAGYARLSDLTIRFLIPALILFLVVLLYAHYARQNQWISRIRLGVIGGVMGTVALEIVRETGFQLGSMPGQMPKLMGVLLLDQFAQGPTALSNIAGWSYHVWNGISFGLIYTMILRQPKWWAGIIYGLLIAIGFMASPAVVALGVGRFGSLFGWGFPFTVLLAHIAFGGVLGWIVQSGTRDA